MREQDRREAEEHAELGQDPDEPSPVEEQVVEGVDRPRVRA